MSPLPSTSGSVKRTLSSSQRASAGTSKSKLVQTTLSFTRKRKHDDTEPGSSQPGTPSLKVPTPSLPKTRSPSTSQKSPQTRPLAPKDNVPTERPRSNSVKKPSPPKKLRLSSPEPGLLAPASGHSADRSGLVPSSQSDEQELCAPKLVVKDPVAVKESVDKWRKETSIAPRSEGASSQAGQSPSEDMHFNIDTGADFNIDVGMQDDIPEDAPEELLPSGPSDVPGPRSETEVSMQLRVRSSASTLGSARKSAVPISPVITVPTLAVTCASSSEPSASRPVTPPLPEATLLPRPSTPLALTTESKTAKIIADIKANAAAALPSSSEDEGPRQLRDLSDSSDDDSFNGGFFASKKNDKGKGKAVASPRKLSSTGFSSPLSKLGSSPPTRTGAKRYSLRNRFVAAQSSSDESDHAPAPAPVRKPRKSNALDALLKEKKQAEKQGKGSSAVQVAEEALASYHRSKQGMKDEMDDEEASASEPRAARRGTPSASATPSATSDRETEGEDEDVDDMDIEGILGEEGGKAVGRILEDDKTSKEAQSRARRKDRVLGVPLWEPALRDEDADMESFELPAFPLSETDLAKDALLRLLADAVTRQDVAQVTVIFNVGVLSQLSHEYQITLIPWLYDIGESLAMSRNVLR
ncbi:hypothetical protein CERSUDRAFT_83132 [Gelatoporia subvermispora B]|uniref:Uncharacterized protein n=1 Tax=Ceriporiopsis subvermispora (strain B) TaxID=914234 RepID=M2RFX1_CERS8|nr:hypothetical protein CERSUDRAFT_83132 [Gelatoporia subvermispora B]